MSTDVNEREQKPHKNRNVYKSRGSDAIYCIGLLGAWYYYLTTATSFGMGLLGILKGIFWPAILVYEAMKFLGM